MLRGIFEIKDVVKVVFGGARRFDWQVLMRSIF